MDYERQLALIERNAWGATAVSLVSVLLLMAAAWGFGSNAIPLPPELSWSRLILFGYFAATAVPGVISVIFSIVFCITRFSHASELLKKRKHSGELLVTTVPMPLMFGATICVTAKQDAAGKLIQDSQRISTAIAAKSDLKQLAPLLMKNDLSQLPTEVMTSLMDDSGNVRILLGKQTLYLLLMTYPPAFAKLLPMLATRKSSS